jgi:hypothetical protein
LKYVLYVHFFMLYNTHKSKLIRYKLVRLDKWQDVFLINNVH